MWFFAIFMPPVYLFMRGRIIAGIINLIVLGAGLVTIPIFGIGFILVFCVFLQSILTYARSERTKAINQQAEAIASKMAEKIQQGSEPRAQGEKPEKIPNTPSLIRRPQNSAFACPGCGKEYGADYSGQFCEHCGAEVKQVPSA